MKMIGRRNLFSRVPLVAALVFQSCLVSTVGGSDFKTGEVVGPQPEPAMNAAPSPTPTPTPAQTGNRFIRWLKNIAGIRHPLVLLSPDGKVLHENNLTFRWGWQPTANPDHFLIRVFERAGPGSWQEIFVSANIPGDQRAYTKTPGFDYDPAKTYKWTVEAYEDASPTFTLQNEQPFSFLGANQLAVIRQHESIYLGWIQQRPTESHLLLLIGSYYAAEGLFTRAHEMFSRFLQARQITVNSSAQSFREITRLVEQELERVEAERTVKQARLDITQAPDARRTLLTDLRTLNLILLDYQQAIANVDALIALSPNAQVRHEWEETKTWMLAERALVQELFPAAARASGLHESNPSAISAADAFPTPARLSSFMHHSPAALTDRGIERDRPLKSFKFELESQLCAWYVADDELLAKYPTPGQKIVKPSYHFGEEIDQMIGAMWKGSILSVAGGLGRESLRRSILTFVSRLAKTKASYFAGKERTPTLDEAWNLIPETRTMNADQQAFVKFGRLIYPIPLDLGKPDTMKRRDELVTYLNKHLKLPAGNENDDKYLGQVLLSNIFLVRTSPVFKLSAGKGRQLALFDTVEVVNEGFATIDASTLALPPKPDDGVLFVLNGGCSDLTAKLKRDRSAHKPSNQLMVRFDSRQRGSYRLRIQLRSGSRIIWRSPSFGLYFI